MANKILVNPETAIVFKASGGDATFTPQNVANNAGRYSAQFDRGSGAKAQRYRWEAKTKVGSNPTVGNVLELYIATAHADATRIDGGLGQSDAAFPSADERRNLQPVDVIVMDKADSTKTFVASGEVTISARYITVAWWNATGQTLTNTAGDHEFVLIPLPDEIQ